jgi:hypothetical protein
MCEELFRHSFTCFLGLVRLLVPVDNHDVVFKVHRGFLDLLFEKNQITGCTDPDTRLLISLICVPGFQFEGEIEHSQCEN